MAFEKFKALFNFNPNTNNQSNITENNNLSDLHVPTDESFIDSIDTRLLAGRLGDSYKSNT